MKNKANRAGGELRTGVKHASPSFNRPVFRHPDLPFSSEINAALLLDNIVENLVIEDIPIQKKEVVFYGRREYSQDLLERLR